MILERRRISVWALSTVHAHGLSYKVAQGEGGEHPLSHLTAKKSKKKGEMALVIRISSSRMNGSPSPSMMPEPPSPP